MHMQPSTVVVLGTGGTIAGIAPSAAQPARYRAAQLGVDELVRGLPALSDLRVETAQIAQLDSKDMTHGVWRSVAEALHHHLGRTEVRGVVVTHGTDTLEETAYFLQRVLRPAKPVVLTAAMRPANALLTDGPQNLLDALTVAALPGAGGTVVVVAGDIWSSLEVRKRHTQALQAFDAGDAGRLGVVVGGVVSRYRAWPGSDPGTTAIPMAAWQHDVTQWPWVEVIVSHAGADARLVTALVEAGVRGLVVAGTGNGTLHQSLDAALRAAVAAGVAVGLTTRCAAGAVSSPEPTSPWVTFESLTAVQARIELMLALLAGGPPAKAA